MTTASDAASEGPLQTFHLPSLWRTAAEAWGQVMALTDAPDPAVLGDTWLKRPDYDIVRPLLRGLEAFVRRVLMLAALALPPQPVKPQPKRPPAGPQPKRMNPDDPTRPLQPVSFRILARPPRAGPVWRRKPDPVVFRLPIVNALGMATRFEALRRAIVHRDRYALRLRRRLDREKLKRARANTAPTALLAPYPRDGFGRGLYLLDTLDWLWPEADDAIRGRFDSS